MTRYDVTRMPRTVCMNNISRFFPEEQLYSFDHIISGRFSIAIAEAQLSVKTVDHMTMMTMTSFTPQYRRFFLKSFTMPDS